MQKAFGTANWSKGMDKIQNMVQETQNVVDSFSSIQKDLLVQTKSFNRSLENKNQMMNTMVDTEKLNADFSGGFDEDESLILMAQNDPEILDMLDNTTKSRILSKMSN